MTRTQLNVNLINASTGGTPTSGAADCRSFQCLVLYATGLGTISGGAVTIEEAPTENYGGTWSDTGATVTPADVTGGKTKAVRLTTGCYGFIRARVTTQVSGGGSWTLDILGN